MTPTKAEQSLLSAIHNKKSSNLSVEQRQLLFLKQLDKQKRSTLADFTFGKIKNWEDYTASSGLRIDAELATQPATYANIKLAFDKKIAAVKAGEELLEVHKVAPKPQHETDKQQTQTTSNELSLVNTESSDAPDEYSIVDCLRNNPSVLYDKHQEKATADIVRALMVDDYHGLGLNARVGSGKTFILGAVIRELWERQWPPLMESVATYPIIYVTRASIVEQTERVLFKKFGLRPSHQVDVTNIDQFRARYGEQFVKEKVVVEYGIEHVVYEWYPLLSPSLIILDESQGVKNIDSTQSKIFQAYNDMKGDNNYLICSSATMFTRVIEAKCLAVATRLEW